MRVAPKIYLVILAALILAFAAFAAGKYLPKAKNTIKTGQVKTEEKNARDKLSQVEVKKVEDSQVATRFPSGLPIEAGAVTLQNLEASDPISGKVQYTKVYASSKTLDENFAAYQQYLKNNNWATTGSVNQDGLKNIYATLGDAGINFTASKDLAGKVTVSVSYIK